MKAAVRRLLRAAKRSGPDHAARTVVRAVQRQRSWWLGAAVILFVGGSILSVNELRLEFSDLHVGSAATLLILLGPLMLLYGAVGLSLLAMGSGVSMTFSAAFRANCAAQLAELLPLPGGAIVRIGALVVTGVPVRRSTALVLLAALLWGSVLVTLASLALFALLADNRFLALIFVSLIATGLVAAQLGKLTSAPIAVTLLAHRLAGCILLAARLTLSFAAIGRPESVTTAFVFGLAPVAGSAAGIAPAGVGLSELFGAALATMVGVDPFAAFLAIGLDRLLGLVSSGAVFVIVERWAPGAGHRSS